MRVRPATDEDAYALGVLILEALDDAPSSDVQPDALGSALDLGRALVRAADQAGSGLWVAELDGELGGLARFAPREFRRAAHVSDLVVLVHPSARRRGLGNALLEGVVRAAQGRVHKLSIRATASDAGLVRLLARRRWRVERVERGAIQLDGELHDVWVYAWVLGGAAEVSTAS